MRQSISSWTLKQNFFRGWALSRTAPLSHFFFARGARFEDFLQGLPGATQDKVDVVLQLAEQSIDGVVS